MAPSEPKKLRDIAHTVSSRIEADYGVDVYFVARGKKYGVQRKELKDLVQSVNDGRLGQQLNLMSALDVAVLAIEGEPRWSSSGALMIDHYTERWDRARHWSYCWSVGILRHVVVVHPKTVDETIAMVQSLEAWAKKKEHTSLVSRPGVVSKLGVERLRDRQRHFVMGMAHQLGPKKADAILDTVGMPVAAVMGRDEMVKALKGKGVGEKTVKLMYEVLGE